MEKEMKFSLEEFPELLSVVLSSIPSENYDDNLLKTCCRIICKLTNLSNIKKLIDVWNSKEGMPISGEASILYNCLYLVYSNFKTRLEACNFLALLIEELAEIDKNDKNS